MEKICKYCGKQFEGRANQKLCSKECSAKYVRDKKRKPQITKICEVCGKPFQTSKSRYKCCSPECSEKRKAKKDKERQHMQNKKYEKKAEETKTILFTLEEKVDICKKAGLEYSQVQLAVEGCQTREEALAKIENVKRKKFLEESELNTTRRHYSNIGAYMGRAK